MVRIWKIEIWMKLRKKSEFENMENPTLACDSIIEAIERAVKAETEFWTTPEGEAPFAVEARKAEIIAETTIEAE